MTMPVVMNGPTWVTTATTTNWVMTTGTSASYTFTLDAWYQSVWTQGYVLIQNAVAEPRPALRRPPQRPRVTERAEQRARAWLLSILSAEQREMFEALGQVELVGSAGGRYRVSRGYQHNVRQLSGQGWAPNRAILCAHPVMETEHGRIPVEDAMVAQILALRCDEPAFLAVANRS